MDWCGCSRYPSLRSLRTLWTLRSRGYRIDPREHGGRRLARRHQLVGWSSGRCRRRGGRRCCGGSGSLLNRQRGLGPENPRTAADYFAAGMICFDADCTTPAEGVHRTGERNVELLMCFDLVRLMFVYDTADDMNVECYDHDDGFLQLPEHFEYVAATLGRWFSARIGGLNVDAYVCELNHDCDVSVQTAEAGVCLNLKIDGTLRVTAQGPAGHGALHVRSGMTGRNSGLASSGYPDPRPVAHRGCLAARPEPGVPLPSMVEKAFPPAPLHEYLPPQPRGRVEKTSHPNGFVEIADLISLPVGTARYIAEGTRPRAVVVLTGNENCVRDSTRDAERRDRPRCVGTAEFPHHLRSMLRQASWQECQTPSPALEAPHVPRGLPPCCGPISQLRRGRTPLRVS